jgi:hypothetical protein
MAHKEKDMKMSEVKLDNPIVKFICADPSVICGEAAGDKGCLGGEKSEGCPMKVEKTCNSSVSARLNG